MGTMNCISLCVCLSVCLSVSPLAYLKKHISCVLLPVRVSGSLLLNVLCTSGFVDGVMFSHDLAYRGKVIRMDVSNSNSFYRHTHARLTALCPGLPGWAGTRKVKPIWILLKQETVSGSGISWAIMQVCTSLQTDNHASTPPLSFL